MRHGEVSNISFLYIFQKFISLIHYFLPYVEAEWTWEYFQIEIKDFR